MRGEESSLVQGNEDTLGKEDALHLDRQGRVGYPIDRRVLAGLRQGKDGMFLTSRGAVRVSPDDDEVRGVIRLGHRERNAGAGSAPGEEGDGPARRLEHPGGPSQAARAARHPCQGARAARDGRGPLLSPAATCCHGVVHGAGHLCDSGTRALSAPPDSASVCRSNGTSLRA